MLSHMSFDVGPVEFVVLVLFSKKNKNLIHRGEAAIFDGSQLVVYMQLESKYENCVLSPGERRARVNSRSTSRENFWRG